APVAAKPAATGAAMDIDGVLAGLASLRDSFGESAGALQANLTAEASALADLQAQANEQLKQLKAVHGVTPKDGALGKMIEKYNEQAEGFDADMAAKKTQLDEEMSVKRAEWSKEVEVHNLEVKERDRQLKKDRKREQDEYSYTLTRKREEEEDAYQQGLKEQRQAQEALLADKRKGFAEREAELAEREAAFRALKAKVEGFEAQLKAAVEVASKMGRGIAQSQARHAANLIARENTGQRRTFEMQIKALQATIKKNELELRALADALEASHQRAKELTVKALEGASNESALRAMQNLAMEQAKNQGKK
ncbi:hypothetical protein KKB55_13385, partial [Myxococcota bacterium]|nr:hypothetical protein [Myxococcota bacterium]MBU1898735.1 hypothetical protein [Myxococcota bacterium]